MTQGGADGAARLWHVTLTAGGARIDAAEVQAALERLSAEQPFLLSGRFSEERAEVRYWEEAHDCGDAAALALRLWGEHRASAALPPWHVVGVEVVARDVYLRRGGEVPQPMLAPAGSWRRF